MRRAGLAAVVAMLWAAGATAEAPLPAHLRCKVSGSGGGECWYEAGALCVGGGITDPSVSLEIFPRDGRLTLNGIRGWTEDHAAIVPDRKATIRWGHDLFGITLLRIADVDDATHRHLFASLVYGDDKLGHLELEFACRRG